MKKIVTVVAVPLIYAIVHDRPQPLLASYVRSNSIA